MAVTEAPELPQVTLFSLGGTIGSTHGEDDRSIDCGVAPRLDAEELLASVPQLRGIADVEAVAFRRAPSGDLTWSDVIALVAEIKERFAAGAVGVVVTQGTDTVEESAFALDLLVRDKRPVVMTGAMRNPTLAGPDGPGNLLAAMQVAVAPESAGLGTLVVFNDEIHAARYVRKSHTSSVTTFRSPTVGPLGWLVEGRPRIAFRTPWLEGTPGCIHSAIPAVAVLTATLGDDLRLIEKVESLGYAGLVIQGFGGGHVAANVAPSIEDLASRVPVVLASRTGAGEILRMTYGFPGSERDLIARGLIAAGFLDGLKARTLLSLLLATGANLADVREAFQTINASATSANIIAG